jgi:uroporphyrinogen-III synthase
MFLVTRPQLKAKETVEALQQAGLTAVSLPLIAIEQLQNVKLRDTHYDVVVVTSTHTEHFLQRQLADLAHGQSEFICVGRSSANMLKDCAVHFPSLSIDKERLHIAQPENSEGIVKLTESLVSQGQRVALIKGEQGRGLIEQVLASRSIVVDTYEVYRRVAESRPEKIKDIEHQPIRCIIVTSVDIAEQVLSSFDALWLEQREWIAASQRIRDFLISKGMQKIRVSEGASTQAIVSCAQQLY